MTDAHLQFAKDILKSLISLPLRVVEDEEDKIKDFINESLPMMAGFYDGEEDIVKSFRLMCTGEIYEMHGLLKQHYIFLYCEEQRSFFVLGPCLTEMFRPQEALHYMQKNNLPESMIRYVLYTYPKMPVIAYEKLHQAVALFGKSVSPDHEFLPYRRLDYQWNAQKHRQILLVERYEELFEIRKIEERYEVSDALTEAVKKGNLALAFHFFEKAQKVFRDFSQRGTDPLRNLQHMCIVLNTQLRCALHEKGIHPLRLDELSGTIAQKIEKAETVSQINSLPIQIVQEYCELSQKDQIDGLKPLIKQAVIYIKSHLSDNLTVRETAKALVVNPNYLSDQFHRCMGMPFIDFLNRERIEQAASLLKYTNMQIQQIATAVGYNNTSYFAKQFMRFKKMTPSEFRRDGMI